MKRRSFIGALVATFATPAKMLAPAKPMLPTGFIYISNYAEMWRREYADCPTHYEPLFKGVVGRYEGVRFIESRRSA